MSHGPARWRRTLRRTLRTYESPTYPKGEALERIAERLIALALEGDMDAIREIGNRLDGKPTERVEVRALPSVRVSDAERLREQLRAARPGKPTEH